MHTRRLAFAALLVSTSALASPAVPAAGTPEAAVRASLQLIRDSKFDEFIKTWCDASKCGGNNTSILTYDLPSAQRSAHNCLHGTDDALDVTRVVGNPAADRSVKVYVQCEPTRLPVPATVVHQDDGRWLIGSFSW